MATPDKDISALFLSGTVVLVAALGGYLWYQAPLKSARPANPGLERHEAALAKRAEARLWQDPLAAVDEHRKAAPNRTETTDRRGWVSLAEDIAAGLHPKAREPETAVLLVTMDGSPYVEGTEQRIRDRYAVGSALSAACYVPEDGSHVGYVLSGADPTIPIPYEWYGPRALRDCAPESVTPTAYRRILVLWLSDELFGDGTPLRSLSSLTTTLTSVVHERFRTRNPTAATVPSLAFQLVGPSSSALMREMVQEAMNSGAQLRWPNARTPTEQGALPMYVASATVSADVIAHSLLGLYSGTPFEAEPWMQKTLSKAGIDLAYRIPSDFDLSQTLLRELALRNVTGDAHIAILAEWDSYYGRTLSSEFVAAACIHNRHTDADAACHAHGPALEALANPADQRRLVPSIRQYSYLRGLDGELPGGESGGSGGGKGKAVLGRAGDRSVDALERPEGESQLDYVRRLADRLEADSENRDFRAIGILGSDVYDKLLILQALRKRFPHSLFFTTDLDARLLHPSQYEWTHNLIIASHFGLQLHPILQQAIPPFRSSYQSATFVAVLQAIGQVRRLTGTEGYRLLGDPGIRFRSETRPLIFEVGRTTADLLPGVARHSGSSDGAGEPEAINHPTSRASEDADRHDRLIRFLYLAVGVLCALYLAIPVIRSIPDEMLSAATGQFVIQTAVALAVLLGGTIALTQWLGSRPDAEPFFWAEGISIWPSELLRMTVAVLCLGFLRFAHTLLSTNASRLSNRYGLEQASAPSARPRRHWSDYGSPTAWSIDFVRNAESPSALWQEHEGFVLTTWRRVIPQTLLLGLLGLILLRALGLPQAPTRGTTAFIVHTLSWTISSLLTGFLIFYVVDAIRVCTGFIHQFSLEPTQWAPQVTQSLCDRRRLPVDLVGEWLDIRFIADRTKAVASLIHYPIIALFLMVLARHRIFDDWSYPPGLLLLYGASAAYILISAVLLSVAAEKARRTAMGRLRSHVYDLRGQAQTPGQGDRCAQQIAQTELLMQDIQGLQEGAFAHWTQHPVFQAVLLPSGGFSVLALLDYFLTQ